MELFYYILAVLGVMLFIDYGLGKTKVFAAKMKYLVKEYQYHTRVCKHHRYNVDRIDHYFENRRDNGWSYSKILRQWEVDKQFVEL